MGRVAINTGPRTNKYCLVTFLAMLPAMWPLRYVPFDFGALPNALPGTPPKRTPWDPPGTPFGNVSRCGVRRRGAPCGPPRRPPRRPKPAGRQLQYENTTRLPSTLALSGPSVWGGTAGPGTPLEHRLVTFLAVVSAGGARRMAMCGPPRRPLRHVARHSALAGPCRPDRPPPTNDTWGRRSL